MAQNNHGNNLENLENEKKNILQTPQFTRRICNNLRRTNYFWSLVIPKINRL